MKRTSTSQPANIEMIDRQIDEWMVNEKEEEEEEETITKMCKNV